LRGRRIKIDLIFTRLRALIEFSEGLRNWIFAKATAKNRIEIMWRWFGETLRAIFHITLRKYARHPSQTYTHVCISACRHWNGRKSVLILPYSMEAQKSMKKIFRGNWFFIMSHITKKLQKWKILDLICYIESFSLQHFFIGWKNRKKTFIVIIIFVMIRIFFKFHSISFFLIKLFGVKEKRSSFSVETIPKMRKIVLSKL
jgi:hypothetical protein